MHQRSVFRYLLRGDEGHAIIVDFSLQGTEAETYLKKPISSARTKKGIVAVAAPKTNQNWRSKHEDFIKTIRAAKEMTAHLAKGEFLNLLYPRTLIKGKLLSFTGGKLSDLPPPPPSDNPDYVQCPRKYLFLILRSFVNFSDYNFKCFTQCEFPFRLSSTIQRSSSSSPHSCL